jgi:hypothetical protein
MGLSDSALSGAFLISRSADVRALGGTKVRVVIFELVILEYVARGRPLDSAHVHPELVFLERVADRV